MTQPVAQPWWKFGHVWLVVAGPLIVVVASFITLYLAVRSSGIGRFRSQRLGGQQGSGWVRQQPCARRAGTQSCADRRFAQKDPRCRALRRQTTQFHSGDKTMWAQRMMWIAWPAFLVAGMLEMLVFAMVDPQDLHWFGQPLEMSRQGIYTLGFFAFWIMTMASSALTTLLSMSPFEVNRCPLPADGRPDGCPKQGDCC